MLDWASGAGHVWADGERWRATGPADLGEGERVRVEALDGLTLKVSRHGPAATDGGTEGERWSR